MKSQGSIEFSVDHRSGSEWATLLNTSEANVSRWRNGQFKPGAAARRLINAHGGPDPSSWNQPLAVVTEQPKPVKAAKPAKPSKKKRAPRKATAASVVAEADLWLAELEDFRADLPSLVKDPRSRANMIANAAKTLHVLGKLVGVGLTLSQRQILDSPNWRMIQEQIIQALKPFGPEPMRAVAQAIESARGG